MSYIQSLRCGIYCRNIVGEVRRYFTASHFDVVKSKVHSWAIVASFPWNNTVSLTLNHKHLSVNKQSKIYIQSPGYRVLRRCVGHRSFSTSHFSGYDSRNEAQLGNELGNELGVRVGSEDAAILTRSTRPIDRKRKKADEENIPFAANPFASVSIFYDETVSKFVNIMMKGGDKSVSQRVLDNTFHSIKDIQLEKYRKAKDDKERERIELEPLKIFHQAIENTKPHLGLQHRYVSKYRKVLVPCPINASRKRFLSIKWIITSARKKPTNSTPMSDKLTKELLDAYENKGSAIAKRKGYHKKVESYREFMRFRWW